MKKKNNLRGVLTKFLKLPKEKQMLVAGFVESVQYNEIETIKEKQDRFEQVTN